MIRSLLAAVVSSLASDFRALPSGFGASGFRKHRTCGAIVIVGDWAGQRGVAADEDGMSISRLVKRYFLYVNEPLLSNVGEPRAMAFSDKFSREIEMEGEQTGDDYPSAIGVAIALNNTVDELGDGSGDLLLVEGTFTEERGNWKMLNIKLISHPGVTVV